MRVIGGKYKGKRFVPPKNFPSRPTTDFAKEALFNILENRITIDELDVLDLYAGTGSISLEFLSREAKSVTSIDNHFVSYKFIRKTQEEVDLKNWHVKKTECSKFLEETPLKFDLIFADPPYDLKGVIELPEIIFGRNILRQNGLLIIEHGRENNFEKNIHFREVRNYGGVHFSFFEE